MSCVAVVLQLMSPREGRLWNFGGTHQIHKRFLTESTGSTWVGKEERDSVEKEEKESKTQGVKEVHSAIFLASFSILEQQPSTEVLLVRRRKCLCSMTRLQSCRVNPRLFVNRDINKTHYFS